MKGRFFLDTNIFIYSLDSSTPKKKKVAIKLIKQAINERLGAVSYQVISELCNVLLRKLSKQINYIDCKFYINSFILPLKRVAPSIELIDLALEIHNQSKISFYDAQIIAAAQTGGCKILYSEDLNSGQIISGVKVVNPFED